MTLNYDCIRDVLLYLEEALEYTDNPISLEHKRITIETVASNLSTYTKNDVRYTIEKLLEAEYIQMKNITLDSQKYIVNGYIDDITWKGHDFLNNIREKTIWEATKLGAKKVGAVSISTISMIAFEIVKSIVTDQSIIKKIIDKIRW